MLESYLMSMDKRHGQVHREGGVLLFLGGRVSDLFLETTCKRMPNLMHETFAIHFPRALNHMRIVVIIQWFVPVFNSIASKVKTLVKRIGNKARTTLPEEIKGKRTKSDDG